MLCMMDVWGFWVFELFFIYTPISILIYLPLYGCHDEIVLLMCSCMQLFVDSDDEEEVEEVNEFDSGFGNVVLVDNLPVVAPEKYEKLENVVRKIFGQMGTIREHGLVMPIEEETKKTKGYAFIEYNTNEVR